MEIIGRETVFKGYYILEKVAVKSEIDDQVFERERFVIPNSVGVLLLNKIKNTVILVKQFRIGPQKNLTEIIAGKIEGKDMNPISTAKREVLEETGYKVDKMDLIHSFHTCPGPVSEKMDLFVAEVSEKVNSGGGLEEEHEEIEVIELGIEEFLETSYYDGKTIIAQQWLKLNQ